jgi:hypothetical protein
MPFQCARGAWSKNEEPSLDELLAEPAVRRLMARDGVEEAQVRRIVEALKERLGMRSERAESRPSAARAVPDEFRWLRSG